MTLEPKGTATTITKKITVVSNDPEQPEFALTMTGALLVDVGARPGGVSINNLKVGEAGKATFNLTMAPDSKAKVLSVTVDDPERFSIRLVEGDPEGDASYEVSFVGSDEVGTIDAAVIVKTDGEHTPELTLPIRASTTYNLQYISKLRFSYRKGRLDTRVLRITGRHTGKPPKIKKVIDPDGLLDVEVLAPKGAMANIRTQVKLDELAKLEGDARTGVHELIVMTDDRDEPKIVFEYRIAPEPTHSAAPAVAPGSAAADAPAEAQIVRIGGG